MQFNHSTTSFRDGIGRWMGTAGVSLPPGLSNREILEQSGTMFNVEKRQVAVQTPTGYVKSPNHYATIRTDTNTILGILAPLSATKINTGIADFFLAFGTGTHWFIFPEFYLCFAIWT